VGISVVLLFLFNQMKIVGCVVRRRLIMLLRTVSALPQMRCSSRPTSQRPRPADVHIHQRRKQKYIIPADGPSFFPLRPFFFYHENVRNMLQETNKIRFFKKVRQTQLRTRKEFLKSNVKKKIVLWVYRVYISLSPIWKPFCLCTAFCSVIASPFLVFSPSLAMPLILFIDRGREKWWETFEYL
jgi:hypothetical protein